MRRFHGFGGCCEERGINLLLHLQHLSEEPDCKGEWMFVESRPIDDFEPHICSCGQNSIRSYYFLENKINGNRTYVGSKCIENIDPEAGKVIAYFDFILKHRIKGTFVESVSDELQKFTVGGHTVLVKGTDIVKHLNPQITLTEEGKWEVLVKYPKPKTLIQGLVYDLKLKAKYVHGQLTFTAM